MSLVCRQTIKDAVADLKYLSLSFGIYSSCYIYFYSSYPCPEEVIITQDLEHFHGWGLTVAMRSEGTFALGQRQCWPYTSGCLIYNKEKYKLAVRFYTGLTKLYQKNFIKCESMLYSSGLSYQAHTHTYTHTVSLHTNELTSDDGLYSSFMFSYLHFVYVLTAHVGERATDSVLPSG